MRLGEILVVLGLCVSNGWAWSGCKENYVQCAYEEKCMPAYSMCNGGNYCKNNWDEETCGSCKEGYFRCGEVCYHATHTCDGIQDCTNNWDERGCGSCNRGALMCDNRCLNAERRCDGLKDCSDNSDEAKCTRCNGNAFLCGSDQCIPSERRCDGVLDCGDGSDEVQCSNCSGNAFLCSESHCVRAEHKCDGVNWCVNGSDEIFCPNRMTNPSSCPAASRCNGVDSDCDWTDEVGCSKDMCRYPASSETYCDGRCLRADQMCDGVSDCKDGYDEADCKPCSGSGWLCDGVCREQRHIVCDGIRDCLDGADEANCTTCSRRAFLCDGHHCVRYTHRCDGVKWCRDGRDELNCNNKKTNTSACRAEYRCNGLHDECYTKDDEVGCSSDMCRSPASKNTFCDGECLPASMWCDGKSDCRDGRDEADCHNRTSSQLLASQVREDQSASLRTDSSRSQDQMIREALAAPLFQIATVQSYTAVVCTLLAVMALAGVLSVFKNRCRQPQESPGCMLVDMQDNSM